MHENSYGGGGKARPSSSYTGYSSYSSGGYYGYSTGGEYRSPSDFWKGKMGASYEDDYFTDFGKGEIGRAHV